MRVGYGRVSSTKNEQTISFEAQEQQFREMGCDEVIIERRSAYKGRRPGWDRLWGLVASGRVTEVLVNDQSRLSRSGDDMDFLNACALKGVTVRAVLGGELEAETYQGFVATSVASVINQAYSKMIGIKSRQGVARRRAAGYYGSGKVPFGYAVEDGRVVPHPQHYEEAQVMFQQLLEMEMNVGGWIRETGMPWTPKGVRKWIDNPMLRGCVRGDWDAVPAVVSWQDWERAQQMLKVRRVIRGQAARQTRLFTGLVRCEGCGKTLHTWTYPKKIRLRCMWRLCPRYSQGISEAFVRQRVIEALAQRAQDLAALAVQPEEPDQREVFAVREQLERLRGMEAIPGIEEAIKTLQLQLERLRRGTASADTERLSALFADPRTLELATVEELRAVMLEFVESIVWPGGLESIEITLR